jgi:hypothetical protein
MRLLYLIGSAQNGSLHGVLYASDIVILRETSLNKALSLGMRVLPIYIGASRYGNIQYIGNSKF